MAFRVGTNRIGSNNVGSNTIGSAFVGFNRVWGSGIDSIDPSTLSPNILLDAYTLSYTLTGGAGTNILNTISGTGATFNNIHHYDSAYMETAYCAALRSDTTLTQIPTSYIRIESNSGVYYANDYPCTSLTGYQNMVYGWDTPAYNSFNVSVSSGFTAIVVARKLDIGTDEGGESLLSLGFDFDAANPTPGVARYLQLGKGSPLDPESQIYNRWYWNDDAQGNGDIRAASELQTFDTTKFTFSAIASSVPNLQSGNFDNIVMTDGNTYATGDGLAGGGENVTASTLMNATINRDKWESTYGVGVFTGRDWDIAAIMFFDSKLSNQQINKIYNYYKDDRGYDMY